MDRRTTRLRPPVSIGAEQAPKPETLSKNNVFYVYNLYGSIDFNHKSESTNHRNQERL